VSRIRPNLVLALLFVAALQAQPSTGPSQFDVLTLPAASSAVVGVFYNTTSATPNYCTAGMASGSYPVTCVSNGAVWQALVQRNVLTLVNVKSLGVVGDGKADDTAALQAIIDAEPTNAHELFLPCGTYLVSSSLIASNVNGLMFDGEGQTCTVIQPTLTLAGLPVLEFVNCQNSGTHSLTIGGYSPAPPSTAIEYLVNYPTTVTPSHALVRDTTLGSVSSNSLINGITYAAIQDQNNDFGTFDNVNIMNFSGCGYNITHSNSLLHDITGGTIKYGASAVCLAGGSFTMRGTRLASLTGYVWSFGAGTYHHSSFISNVVSDGLPLVLQTSTSAVDVVIDNLEVNGGSVTAAMVIDYESPAPGHLAISGSNLFTGSAATQALFLNGTGQVTINSSKLGYSAVTYNGALTLSGNSWEAGVVTMTPGATSTLVQLNDTGGGFQKFMLSIWHGASRVFSVSLAGAIGFASATQTAAGLVTTTVKGDTEAISNSDPRIPPTLPLSPAHGGIGASERVPPGLRFMGTGEDGPLDCSGALSGTQFRTTFTVSKGNTCTDSTANRSLVVYATGACTIAGTIIANGAAGGSSGSGDYGAGGGGGGGGAAVANAGSTTGPSTHTYISSGAAGTAGKSGGNAGSVGSYMQRVAFSNPVGIVGLYQGGAAGGRGGSGGGMEGNGGQAVILICSSINFSGTIDVSGSVGSPSMGDNVGAGGGGGGGYVWLVGRDSVTSTGSVIATGGSGGACANPAIVLGVPTRIPAGVNSGLGAVAHVSAYSGGNPTAVTLDTPGVGYNFTPTCSVVGNGGGSNTGSGATCTVTMVGGGHNMTVGSIAITGGNGGYGSGTTYTGCGIGGYGGTGWLKTAVME